MCLCAQEIEHVSADGQEHAHFVTNMLQTAGKKS